MRRRRSRRVPPLVLALVLLAPASAGAQEAEGIHEVRRGDTLWDLAARYLADPYRWREIFERNPDVVEDPHWIFPGERLRIPGLKSPIEAAARPPEPPPATRARVAGPEGTFPETSVFRRPPGTVPSRSRLYAEEGAPLAVVSRSDMYGAALLTSRSTFPIRGTTARLVREQIRSLKLPSSARLHDRVMIALHGLAVEPGDLLQAMRWGRAIAEYGTVFAPMAMLKVDRVVGDSARAVVVELFDDYRIGDPVIPPEEYVLDPSDRPEPVEHGLQASLVGFEVPQEIIGPGDRVFLDVGANAGVMVGDEFAVFSTTVPSLGETPEEDRLCTVRVVRVSPTTATARVIEIRDPGTRVGAPARLVRHMPGPTGG